ncbi:polyprenyl synthetase family protein [Streptomyces sp. NPDC059816]|uniref:polyprenyl synthetase family protein n=1 Tax=Streptomyces sp. NPDC059816 TaxID=3346960 RepID=UPI00365F0B05
MRFLPGVAPVVGHHAGWGGEVAAGKGGKALRPALVLLCADACGETPDDAQRRAATAAAVAVEMVHDFTLLHDDVMDGDRTRRGRPAAWVRFGTDQAILAGDGLLALSFTVLREATGRTGAPGVLSAGTGGGALLAVLADALLALCAGQTSDLAAETNPDLTESEYLALAVGKTASLFEAACLFGSRAAGAPPEIVQGYREFGYHVGLAFQLSNDLYGICGEPGLEGKTDAVDLVRGKKTFPVVAAVHSATSAGRRLARLYRTAAGQPPPSDVVRVLLHEAGAVAYTEARMRHHREAALAALERARPLPGPARYLRALAASACASPFERTSTASEVS